jgi:dephospho-CoA kinase
VKTLGLTGGIGSGKTAAARLFADLGAYVVLADDEAKRLMHEDPELVAAIREAFGEGSYDAEGRLDRPYLAGRVFGDPEAVARLNALVHPRVRDAFPALRARAEAEGAPLLVYEAALLLEGNLGERFDAVAVVDAPVETRIARAMARDGSTREAVLARMRHQLPSEALLPRADYVIRNDGSLEDLRAEVERVFHALVGPLPSP